MAEPKSTFVRAFLPGLVIGLVVGGTAGAVLPDLLDTGPRIPFGSFGHQGAAGRDVASPALVPETLDEQTSEQQASPDAGAPADTSGDEGGSGG